MSFFTPLLEHYLVTITVSLLAFEFARVIYRLTLHPLASFPGPKLAGATHLYAIYHDLWRGGKFVKMLPKLHEEYGPIVRIMPNQIHVKDLNTYHKVFRMGTDFDKDLGFYSNPLLIGSLLLIPDTPRAKVRRDMYNPYFSKAAVRKVEHLVVAKLNQFLTTLSTAANAKEVVNIFFGFRCLTADVIMDYSYQKDFGALKSPGFRHELIEAFDDLTEMSEIGTYYPKSFSILNDLANMMPKWLIAKASPPMLTVVKFQEGCRANARELMQNPRPENAEVPTVFDLMLKPDEKRGQPAADEDALSAEAVLMLGAGMDTTANAMTMGTFQVCNNPRVYKKLKEELRRAIPDKGMLVDSVTLENLPYLTGVVKEALRLSYGVPGRIPRVVPKQGATICGRRVPGGTVISLSAYVFHTDDNYFENANEFLPERWLGDKAKELDKNMLSFSRGSRICLGLNLATAELYLTLGHLFRRFEIRLEGTGERDLEWDDYYLPSFRGHLKVRLEAVME